MKKLTTLIILVFIFSCAVAQEIEWQNTIGGNGHDQLRAVRQTGDGGCILGGASVSNISGDKTENSNGDYDYWIVKTDAAGNIQWQNSIGGSGYDYLIAIEQTNDMGYILGGFSSSDSSGDKAENNWDTSSITYDYWIVKTDSLGNIQWQNNIGGNGVDQLSSIQQTADGGYILGGFSNSNISGDKAENCLGPWDYWIVKTDSLGNIQWQNTIGGNGVDDLESIKQTADGGYILSGVSGSGISGDKTENNFNSSVDYWIVKTDSLGNIQWQNTIGGNDDDWLKSISQTTDGGYILGGYSNSNISGNKTESSNGDDDYWIVKTDSLGNIQWQNTIGGNDDDWLKSISQTTDGGYILGGYSNSNISGDKAENSWNNSNDYWIVKTDSLGSIQWQNTVGGKISDQLFSIEETTDGGYILGGLSWSDISGDKTENSFLGGMDYWIVKITENYNSITGNVFADLNSNNVQDAGEPSLKNKKIEEQNTGRFAFSEQNGHYSVSVLDSGNYTITLSSLLSYYNAVPVTHSAYFTNMHQTDPLNDFALQPSGSFNDLKITISPLSPFRSGFNASYTMHYENVGTTTLNASVVFYLSDSNYTFVSSPVNPSLVNVDSVAWNNITLAPFQSDDITVTIHVDSGVPIGTQLNAFCVIRPVAGDSTPGNNYSSWNLLTTGSIDPNDILVDEDTLTTAQFASQQYLEYIIRFQNTGNDTCFNTKILNPIDTNKLELSSIEFVASSHPVNLKWIPWERNMEFKFDNILLPDSNINEPLSHGYVRYWIKPKTSLSAGDSILNNAAIYFDNNSPVITNTAVTRIVLSSTTYATISTSACNSYLSPSGNYLWTTSGTFIDTIPNVYGGDSIITVNLIITYSTSSLININACDFQTSPSGNYTWTTSGIYHDTIPNSAGCDSIITINLTITIVDTSVTFTAPSLIANATNAAYQWMYCDSILISGATGQSFAAASNGMYAVIVTQNNCTDTSSCYTVMNVGIDNINSPNNFIVSPNPSANSITIAITLPMPQKVSLKIYDLNGRCIETIADKNFNAGRYELAFNVRNFANGIYQLCFQAATGVENKKLVIQR